MNKLNYIILNKFLCLNSHKDNIGKIKINSLFLDQEKLNKLNENKP
jgi:hypothetical protein